MHLALLGKRHKTLLLFAIRDHAGNISAKALTKQIRADMRDIWNGLSKPKALEHHSMSDFFERTFVTLPHNIYVPKEFDTAVTQLRTRFTDKLAADYVFKPAYWKLTSAEQLANHLAAAWQSIRNGSVACLEQNVSGSGKEPLLVSHCNATRSDACFPWEHNEAHVRSFHEMATNYAHGKFLEAIKPMQQSIAVEEEEEEVFAAKMMEHCNSAVGKCYVEKWAGYELYTMLTIERKKALDEFQESAQACVLDGTSWMFTRERSRLKHDVSKAFTQLCIKKVAQQHITTSQKQVQDAIEQTMAIMNSKIDAYVKQLNEKTTEIANLNDRVGRRDATIRILKRGR
ncbi:root hair defective 3 GTP-binding protein-domain-containing protein [Thamnocephalis sphaerospora]|uniref:Root hair defective 3 GTP-binding protein-domain-containing protein n=1 Tax=Thamnocephalis sphaerospora TaxID=78915 RepID=A0A4P9XHF2_9FUNG|nr:root hair defective 3 GTP-binding protein-domain-containing protein [Thamnocephalis sphaerospora]|eukprot:RKP05103.1 root hair defective 3 GTP-binding protein-domain-containing protein [Thamnocephalis sphaerospora]